MLLNSSFIIEKLLMLVGSLTFLSIIPKGKRGLNITKEKWQRSALRGRRKFVCVQGLSFLVFLWCAFFWIKKQLYCQCTIFYFCHFFSVSCIAGLSFLAWLDCRMRFIQVYALKRIYIYIYTLKLLLVGVNSASETGLSSICFFINYNVVGVDLVHAGCRYNYFNTSLLNCC